MGRNNTRAAKNIAKMYEQLGLTQDDIFHKTKLLLSIYRDVVWATLSDCRCVNAEINYYGDDLNDALIYLEEFAPDIERSEFEHRVCNLFENKWMIDLIDKAILLLAMTRQEGARCTSALLRLNHPRTRRSLTATKFYYPAFRTRHSSKSATYQC